MTAAAMRTPSMRLGSVSKKRLDALCDKYNLPRLADNPTRWDKNHKIHDILEAQRRQRENVLHGHKTPSQQAARIMARFGGPAGLADALNALPDAKYHRERTAVYKWLYPRSRGGSDGLIPHSAYIAVKMAAAMQGIFLTAEDWLP